MKEIQVKVFGDAEHEAVEILHDLGLTKMLARVLIFLAGHPGGRQSEMEKVLQESQPRVSGALKEAINLFWVEKSILCRADHIGRSTLAYKLSKPLSAIVAEIEGREKNQIEWVKNQTMRLKELVEA